MKGSIKLSLPFYIGVRVKKMLGMNWYAEVGRYQRAKVKRDYHVIVGKTLPDGAKLQCPIRTHYKVYYKNPVSDACNIIAVIDKFLMDALQEYGVISDDTVKHYVQSSWEVVGQDKDNPRIEVTIEEIKCGTN